MGEYRPPASFWKETRRLDNQIQALSWPAGRARTGNLMATMHRASWQYFDNETPPRVVLWEGYSKKVIGRIASQLMVDQVVESADDQEDLGHLIEEYNYQPQRLARRFSKATYVAPADYLAHLNEATQEEFDTAQHGPTNQVLDTFQMSETLTADDYEKFLVELRRGASGEYMGHFPPDV